MGAPDEACPDLAGENLLLGDIAIFTAKLSFSPDMLGLYDTGTSKPWRGEGAVAGRAKIVKMPAVL